jgi:hypothetical protein
MKHKAEPCTLNYNCLKTQLCLHVMIIHSRAAQINCTIANRIEKIEQK